MGGAKGLVRVFYAANGAGWERAIGLAGNSLAFDAELALKI